MEATPADVDVALAAATAVGAGVTNLTRGTRYDIYAVAALTPAVARGGPDGSASPYASAPPRLVKRVIRTLDETAPFFLPGFPRVGAVAPRGVTVAVRVDEAAAVWVVALPTGAPVPSAADVAAAAVHLAGATFAAFVDGTSSCRSPFPE